MAERCRQCGSIMSQLTRCWCLDDRPPVINYREKAAKEHYEWGKTCMDEAMRKQLQEGMDSWIVKQLRGADPVIPYPPNCKWLSNDVDDLMKPISAAMKKVQEDGFENRRPPYDECAPEHLPPAVTITKSIMWPTAIASSPAVNELLVAPPATQERLDRSLLRQPRPSLSRNLQREHPRRRSEGPDVSHETNPL